MAATSTSSGFFRPNATPPTSDLLTMSGERIFSATGSPGSMADFGGRLRGGGEMQRHCHRNSVGAEGLTGFVGIQTATTGGQRDLNDAAGGFGIRGESSGIDGGVSISNS
jgi:hypothetical protein